jgi:thymidylate synthase (FAD)
MILVKPSFVVETSLCPSEILELIESAGRTCYKSEPKDAYAFVKMIIKRGHESVLEHASISVRFIVDRGVSHELVRHRLAAYSQESTRYCNYSGGVSFVIPPWVKGVPDGERNGMEILTRWKKYVHGATYQQWLLAMARAESSYLRLLEEGWTPQQARSVLPNSLKTEIVMTANLREWRHVFALRCAEAAHPQMREIMLPLQAHLQHHLPEVFGVSSPGVEQEGIK